MGIGFEHALKRTADINADVQQIFATGANS